MTNFSSNLRSIFQFIFDSSIIIRPLNFKNCIQTIKMNTFHTINLCNIQSKQNTQTILSHSEDLNKDSSREEK